MITRYLFLFACLLSTIQSSYCWAQVKNKGLPFIKNYTTDDYHAHDQNWYIGQDKRGIIYVGNSSGLLEFDGVKWRLLEIPNKSTTRSVKMGQDGIMYVGAQNFIGYVDTDSTGKTYVASLMNQVPKDVAGFKDIWDMVVTNEGVICRSRSALFVLKDKKLKAIRPKKRFTTLCLINNQAHFRDFKVGTFKLVQGKLVKVPQFNKKIPMEGFPFGKNKSLLNIFTQLYIYNGDTLTPFAPHIKQFLLDKELYCSTQIDDNHYAFGTSSAGIVILNKAGQVVQHIHKGNGLQSNSVYNLYIDHHHNLWAGLAKGIAFIELNSPFSVLDASSGLEGSTYYTYVHQNKLLTGTSQGFFYKNWLHYENPLKDSIRFKTIPNLVNQTWQFKTFKNQLLAAFNPGILKFNTLQKPVKVQALKKTNGNMWTIISLNKQPNLLMAGGKRGLILLEWKDKQWQVKNVIKGFSKNSRYIQEGKAGTVWVSSDQHGIYKLTLNTPLDSIVNIKFYDKTKGLPANTYNRLFKVNGENMFATENGVYLYDETQDKMVRETKLNKLIGDHKMLVYLRNDAQQGIWYVAHKEAKDKYLEVGLLQKQANGSYKKITNPFRKLRGSFIEKLAPHLNPIDDKNVLFATKEGVIHYAPQKPRIKQPFKVLLREISLTGAKDSIIFGGTFANAQGQMTSLPKQEYQYPIFKYTYNSFRFNVSSTFYADNHKNEFRYRLAGLDKEWSPWTKETYKEYTNLREGSYILHIQTRNLYQEKSPVFTYSFQILPPWHRTIWAYTGYTFVSIILIGVTIKLYTRRLEQQKDKLEKTVEARTAEIRHKNDEILLKNSELEQQKEEIQIQAENLKEANTAIEHKNSALEQQKEEIQIQAEILKTVNNELVSKSDEIEQAYQNVKLLSEIGQEITSKLSLSQIVETVYNNVNNLMDVAEFGIGLYDPKAHTITFNDYIHLGEKMPQLTVPATDENRFGVLCVLRQKEIIVNDVYKEYHNYVESLDSYRQDELLNAFICIPLIVEQEVIGLVSVQSLQSNVYTNYHLNLLRNLAVYITIALQNTDSYTKIELQKFKIETQNQEITASIRYAQKIQAAILPSSKSFEKVFTDHFIIYEPKDIVSGDFYWMSHVKKRVIIDDIPSFEVYSFVAAVDCTGHGVPGAFMSMIGSRLLSEIVNEKKVFDPKKIISKIQEGIRKGLHQKESDNNDGMDICLCRVQYIDDSDKVELIYSNAKRPLYYTHQKKLHQIQRNRFFIGGWIPKQIAQELENHTVQLKRTDILYLSSDGFVDTPNNNRKSFGTKQFITLLEEIMHEPLNVQRTRLLKAKTEYQEEADQRDDIVILGIQL
ncbi:SpoIIE family protein phosphatase [Microscilla marina]|uniref:Two component regulator three Y motif family n=1 Tax=Microscilla marina ATCC 23134 TaxID=313606 RepID=A1ZGF6_MICM2|nr:SpoIIE family protein phosphatase [Microscilla marina]EAY30573.1 Two component regulator three Y motif family [Microscilla marina ATCC 23134]